MPTVTIEEPVTLEDAAKALQDRLGDRYEVTRQRTGDHDELKVKQSATTTATVQQSRDGDATTFHVHGGGLVITRMVNEFGIARKVAATIKESFGTSQQGATAQQGDTTQRGDTTQQGDTMQQGDTGQQGYTAQQDDTTQQGYSTQQDDTTQQGYTRQQDDTDPQGYIAPQDDNAQPGDTQQN
jgi:hypothetical protein